MSANMMMALDVNQIRNLREWMLLYNQITDHCFKRCVVNLNSRDMTEEEGACADACAEKQMHYNNKVMKSYMVEQPLAMEKKMAEATIEAEKTAKILKEQGIDVSKMAPEELARAAFAARTGQS